MAFKTPDPLGLRPEPSPRTVEDRIRAILRPYDNEEYLGCGHHPDVWCWPCVRKREAAHAARIAELEAERTAFVALAKASERMWLLVENGWLAKNTSDFREFTDAIAHPAVQRALKETP